jgi:hypothetical protein
MCDLAFAFLEIRLSQEVAVRKQVVFALVVYLHIRAKIMLIKFVGAHPCVAFLPCTAFRAQTPAKSLSEAPENIGRSPSEETLGSWPTSKGGSGAAGSRHGVDRQLGKQRNSADGTLPSGDFDLSWAQSPARSRRPDRKAEAASSPIGARTSRLASIQSDDIGSIPRLSACASMSTFRFL